MVIVVIILVLSQILYFTRVSNSEEESEVLNEPVELIEFCDNIILLPDDLLSSRDYTRTLPEPCFSDADSTFCKAEVGVNRDSAQAVLV